MSVDVRSTSRTSTQGVAQLAAAVAGVDVGAHVGVEDVVEGPVEMIGEQLLRAAALQGVPHGRATSRRADSRRLASSSRPRLMRLFTVPSGTSRMLAISS